MIGGIRRLTALGIALVLLVPLTAAEPALLQETVAPLLEPEETATTYCTGIAPVPQPRCDAWFYAYSSITLSPGGTFTGELTCKINSPLGYWREYRFQMASGLVLTYGVTGPGLVAGYIHMHCEGRGLFGAGGSYAGAGLISVRVDYA